MSYGYLQIRTELVSNWPWPIRIEDPYERIVLTRWEEYDFVLRNLSGSGPVLDAACGWVPDLHILPRLVTEVTGRPVVALDANPDNLMLHEEHPDILRMTGDITGLPFADNSFDTVLCISTLEHLFGSHRGIALAHLCRVARHEIILTTDGIPVEFLVDAVRSYGFDPGEYKTYKPILTNDKGLSVCYLIARRTAGSTKTGRRLMRGDSGIETEETSTPSPG